MRLPLLFLVERLKAVVLFPHSLSNHATTDRRLAVLVAGADKACCIRYPAIEVIVEERAKSHLVCLLGQFRLICGVRLKQQSQLWLGFSAWRYVRGVMLFAPGVNEVAKQSSSRAAIGAGHLKVAAGRTWQVENDRDTTTQRSSEGTLPYLSYQQRLTERHMESHDKTLVADCRPDPNSTVPADNAAHPPTTTEPAASSSKTSQEVETKAGKRRGTVKTNRREKTSKKHRHRKAKVVISTVQRNIDSDSNEDESESPYSSSGSESESESDDAEDHSQLKKKKKKKKNPNSMLTFLKGKSNASSKSSRKKNAGNDSGSGTSDSSDTSDSSSSDSEGASRKVKKEKSKKDEDDLTKQMGLLQLQVSQLQQQLVLANQQQPPTTSAYGYPPYLNMNPALIGGIPAAYHGGIPSIGLQSFPPAFQPPPPPPPPPVEPPPRGGPPGRFRGGHPRRGRRVGDESATDNGFPPHPQSRKKGMRADFKRVDWVWDTSMYTFKLQDTAETTNDSQYNDYIFHVRRTFDCEGKYRATFVDIKSKLLRECLQDVIGNIRGISLVDGTPKLDPNLLFLYLEEFREHLKQLKHLDPAGDNRKELKKNQTRIDNKRKHLKVLVKYLDKDYAKVKDSLYPMLQNGLITFDLLWALWKPNTLAYAHTYGSAEVPRVFRVETADRQASIVKGNFYYVDGKYFEYDGKRFGYGNMSEEINEFPGARKITSLPCYPLQYHKDEEQVRKVLVERGKKFVSLSGAHYKSYSGVAYFKKKKNVIVKFNVKDSRVMVDPGIFRRINPNYYVSMVRPKDHDILSDDEYGDVDPCGCDSQDDSDKDGVKYVTKAFRTPDGKVCLAQIPRDEIEDDENDERLDTHPSNSKAKGTPDGGTPGTEGSDADTDFTDEDYLIASPVVLGFSFSEKQWLEFTVSGVREIKWNDQAWDSLVLDAETKDLIRALVESRKFNAARTIDDVIQGKGKGLVTVLHGPPGTGKTLTAEGISELLKCPLYMASAGELSTDSRYLEAELQKILDICHAWGAILLLDEADVFLEKRNMHDLHRNALVSIFLRQLEYFQGILFLTTNRVETFDEAFQSRIHIALRYENLTLSAKKSIFEMFIERVRALGTMETGPFTPEDIEKLARNELNGREIKNAVCSAQDLAVSKGEPLSMKHVAHVLGVHAKFGRDLRGGQVYDEAMRSYF
ncbi:ATPase family AAA domain-containing protein [Paramyrothecium foliicola]|nr:ATPase family AAA domain-containing protein [Paramyrothecium foliicola]